ncbi:transcriptional regulator [Azospirillum baldaniorum]|uniref:response regulator n=1 Tax=Azospirillum baldaniorum TaxID=1064539 RepID=UPI000D5FE245|nr:response regulator [Azospirillum baldaniorum]AWJ88345.1 transcriptional regulator [Azospirillum baldaniorum]TWA68709.1 response regulator receiver domain-containing protein [Azospirillum baldaniorum]TWA80141.1 response regulator receiver domain-containing protein [Azospirillum brasilense]
MSDIQGWSQDDDDDLLFADEDAPDPSSATSSPAAAPWKLLIVDDDPEVHAITRVVLNDVTFDGRRLQFLSAHSGVEARAILSGHPDIAAVLLDVVMETEDAGLRLVHHIREVLGNRRVRIILRTGQPGQAPERQVIVSYDINDYKAKSELTAQKLFTTTVAALRSYQHIDAIERNRQGLETIVDAAGTLFEQRSMDRFAVGVVERAAALLPRAAGAFLCAVPPGLNPEGSNPEGPAPAGRPWEAVVLCGTGVFADAAGRPVGAVLPEAACADIAAALARGRSLHRDDHSVALFQTQSPGPGALFIGGHGGLPEVERRLLEIFCSRMSVGFDNVSLYEQLRLAQIATVHALGKLAEYKDEVTGEHVRRIGRWATAIARELQARDACGGDADDRFCELIGLASMLHDVGKVAIPDRILRKPGKLDPEEMVQMREHAAIGGRILRDASGPVGGRSYLSMGAEIAESHHEKFDGTGYPHGLAGDAIPLSGRIVAVADVYDALLHRRPYKEAWEWAAVVDLIRAEAGRHFDPRVVDAFVAILERGGPEA